MNNIVVSDQILLKDLAVRKTLHNYMTEYQTLGLCIVCASPGVVLNNPQNDVLSSVPLTSWKYGNCPDITILNFPFGQIHFLGLGSDIGLGHSSIEEVAGQLKIKYSILFRLAQVRRTGLGVMQ